MINMSSITKNRGLLLGTIIGGAIGAASAFLLAPKTGAKLREDIATKYRTINDKMQQMASTVGDNTSKITNRVSEVKGNLTDKANDISDTVLNAWQDSKEEVKREAENQRQPFSTHINNKN
jgi:gas vesicle protein